MYTKTKKKTRKAKMNVKERFLKYVSLPTASDEESTSTPSTKKQLTLAKQLVRELLDLGVTDAHLTPQGYVYASIPKNAEGFPNIGFIAHLDTSPDAPDYPVSAREILYTGGDIVLNSEKNTLLRPQDYPTLDTRRGERLIVTDGETLLGADDKAGIAEIMSAVEKILSSDVPHGKVSVAFTPDEEIGRGADLFDVKKFAADFAYTVDGGALGELEYENFNAASGKIVINGKSHHPGSAKGRMINAARIACEFASLLPTDEIPECTEGYEGFFHITAMSGECEHAEISYIIRDHDRTRFEERKTLFESCAQKLAEKYGEGVIECTVRDSYYNMREIIEKNMHTVERVRTAMSSLGITPKIIPIRGGTDGSRLSFMGLPCPNICTGGENFHSRFEYVSLDAMEKITELIVKIVSLK